MNKQWKTGILLLTLAIPVFIWLFLKYFGQNSFDLPVFYTNGIDSLAECGNGPRPHALPSFSLTKTSGDTLTANDFDGDIVISYFLPANCTDSCELVLERLATLQNVFSRQEKFKIVVFAQPVYSLPDVVSLEQRFNINPALWNFVIGKDEAQINYLMQCGFVLASAPEHMLVLTDAKRRIRGYYQATDPEEVDRLKGEVKILNYMQEAAYHDEGSKRQ